MSSDDRRVVRVATQLIDEAREHVPAYAARRHLPAGTWHIAELLGAYECHRSWQDLPDGVEAAALPPVGGTTPIVLSNAGTVSVEIQERHELAHVIAGEAGEPVFLDDSEMGFSERVADLFALADTIPGTVVRTARRGRRPWRDVLREVAAFVRYDAPGWTESRVRDRARLRVLMYRMNGI